MREEDRGGKTNLDIPDATCARSPAVIATTPLPHEEIANVLDNSSSGNPLFLLNTNEEVVVVEYV